MIIQCPECGHDVSDKAVKCPQCGYPLQSPQLPIQPDKRNKIWLWITLATVTVVAIGGAVWFLLKNTVDDPNAIVELTPEFIEKVQKYDKLTPFSEGRAAVCRGELWGYINTKGDEVIPCQYSRAEVFHEGLTQVVKGVEPFYINRKGDKVFDGEGGRFSEGLALLTDGRVVDTNGKEKFKVNVYDMAYSMRREPDATRYTDYPCFENGVITIYTLSDEDMAEGRYENVAEHSYDTDGKMLSEVAEMAHKSSYQEFSEDIDYDKEFDNGNRTGLKDVNGNIVIAAKFSEVSYMSNGVALVTLRENDAYYASINGHDIGWSDGIHREYVPRYYGFSDSQGNTTFSKETLQHIEEANRIGREKWAEEMERRREEERRRKEGRIINVTINIESDERGNLTVLTGNYKVGSLYSENLIATDKIQVPDGKVWVYEGSSREGGAFFNGINLYTLDRNDSNGNETWSEYEPWRYKKKLTGLNGKYTAPLVQRYAIDGGDYVVISALRGKNKGRHSLKIEFRELDRDYYREKCGYDF